MKEGHTDIDNILFTDFLQTFDNVIREKLIKDTKKLNILEKFIRFTQRTMKRSNKRIITNEGLYEEVQIVVRLSRLSLNSTV